MTKQEMATLLRKIAQESRETTARFETFAFKRVEFGDVAQLAETAHATANHNAMALDHIAGLLEGTEE